MRASFQQFHDWWTDRLSQLISQLGKTTSSNSDELNRRAHRLVKKVVAHYEDYYRVKIATAHSNVLTLFAAPWASSLERALYWVTDFRPTTIFHLVYTASSIGFECRVADILQGRRTGDMGELSPIQLGRVSELQCVTVNEENKIGEEIGAWQEAVGEVEVQWAVTRSEDGLEILLGKLGRIVAKADELRMRTIRRMVELLTTQQAIEFLVAVAELQFGLTGLGSFQDRQRGIRISTFG